MYNSDYDYEKKVFHKLDNHWLLT